MTKFNAQAQPTRRSFLSGLTLVTIDTMSGGVAGVVIGATESSINDGPPVRPSHDAFVGAAVGFSVGCAYNLLRHGP